MDQWQAAVARHKEWEGLQKQRAQLQNPAFRKWLRTADPETYEYLTEEEPIEDDFRLGPTDTSGRLRSSNRPEDYE